MTNVVYRLIGPLDSLLYVGVTNDIAERTRRHRCQSVFGHLIERYEVESFSSRSEAMAAETAAIRTECPIFNSSQAGERAPFLTYGLGELVWQKLRRAGIGMYETCDLTGIRTERVRRLLADPDSMRLTELSRIADLLGTTAGAIVTEYEAAA